MRPFFVLSFALLGCSQTQPVKDSGPPLGLACSDAINGCSCVSAAPPVGSCSPTTLAAPAHCCGHTGESGKLDTCYCAKDGTCYTQGMNLCVCNALPTPDGGTTATSCPKPMNGHCCKTITDAAQGDCHCSGSTCTMSEMEVPSCTGGDGNLQCGASTMSVPSCQ